MPGAEWLEAVCCAATSPIATSTRCATSGGYSNRSRGERERALKGKDTLATPAPPSHSPAVLLSSGVRRGPPYAYERTNRPAYVRHRTEALAVDGNT